MKNAREFLSEHEKTRIVQAVAEAESKTDAEIVPAIATASGRYDRAEDIVGLWVGGVAMAIVWGLLQLQDSGDAQWGTTWNRFELPLLLVTLVLGFVVGAFSATHIGWLRRVFTPGKEMREEVRNAASKVFFDSRIHHTQAAMGLLIYISLFERMATVMADQKALELLGQTALDELCVKLIGGIKAGDLATSLCEVIADVGARLAVVLPHEGENPNEVANALLLID